VGREDDRAPDGADRGEDGVPVLEVERGRRLVEKQRGGPLRERTGEHHAPPLAARELRDRPPPERGDAHRRERRVHGREVLDALAEEPLGVRVPPARDDFLHGERELPVLLLRQERDPPRDLVARHRARGPHVPPLRLDDPAERPQERRLPAAVRPDQRDVLAGRDEQVDAVERRVLAVPHRDPVQLKGVHGSSRRAARPTAADEAPGSGGRGRPRRRPGRRAPRGSSGALATPRRRPRGRGRFR